MANPPPLQPLPPPTPIPNIRIHGGNQPNWNNISNALDTLGQEVPLITNANPAATVNGVNAIIAALNMQNMAVVQALNGMTVALNAMNTTLTNHTTALQNIQNCFDLQPMRIRNATATLDTHLVYPPGTVVAAPLPLTKKQAVNINGQVALQVLNLLGVPNIPAGAAACITLFLQFMGIE